MKTLVVISSLLACVLGASVTKNEPISPSFDGCVGCRLLLRTRDLESSVEVRLGDLNSVTQNTFRRGRELWISIHGWNANANDGTHHTVARVLLQNDDVNFVFLDWSPLSTTANYLAARNRVREAGGFLAAFVDWLVANQLLEYNQVKIVGFSLGAHVAGMCGKQTNRKVNTIVGLDPAGPLFSQDVPTERLASGDAEYVEAIHTNGRANGIGAQIADADFYPNGGRSQPGCTTGTGCSHSRAVSLWLESVTNPNFLALSCRTEEDATNGNCADGTVAFMGGVPSNHHHSLRGNFHLLTNAASPFARG